MATMLYLFDRRSGRRTASMPFAELGLAITTAKFQGDLAIVCNGRVHGIYLNGKQIDETAKPLKGVLRKALKTAAERGLGESGNSGAVHAENAQGDSGDVGDLNPGGSTDGTPST